VITRRRFGVIAGSTLVSIALGSGCRREIELQETSDGRLTARPSANVETSAKGASALGLDNKGNGARDAILQLPTKATSGPLPLVDSSGIAGKRE